MPNKKEKVLIIASVASMIGQFNMPFIELLIEMGYNVDVACNFRYGSTFGEREAEKLCEKLGQMQVNCYQIDFSRNVFNLKEDYAAYKQLMCVMRGNSIPLEQGRNDVDNMSYAFAHCHSPIGGAIGRMVAHKLHVKVIYTAHGFHFYKGAPKKNWLLFYPVEKFFARWTDVLIAITKEDYKRAEQKFRGVNTVYVPGVGVNVEKICAVKENRGLYTVELGIPEDAIILLSVGELNKNKNHEAVIRALAEMAEKNVYYIVCGQGKLGTYLEELVHKLELGERVKLLGYRTDVVSLMKSADCYIHPSYREGLSVAIMEAMACELPVICRDIRGNRDLVVDEKGGYLVYDSEKDAWKNSINKIVRKTPQERLNMGKWNREVIKCFDSTVVLERMKEIYGCMR